MNRLLKIFRHTKFLFRYPSTYFRYLQDENFDIDFSVMTEDDERLFVRIIKGVRLLLAIGFAFGGLILLGIIFGSREYWVMLLMIPSLLLFCLGAIIMPKD